MGMFKVLSPKIIFVDGPTGSGKGYFIENLIRLLNKKLPDIRITKLDAKVWALGDHSTSEDRKYVSYQTPKNNISNIFNGHLNYIKHITALIEKNETDLIISDRSFLSFVAYNIYNACYEEQNMYIETFKHEYMMLGLTDVPSLMVQIISGLPTTKNVELLSERLKSRNDGKIVDKNWLRTLIYNYAANSVEKIIPTTHYEKLTSSNADEVVKGYFGV